MWSASVCSSILVMLLFVHIRVQERGEGLSTRKSNRGALNSFGIHFDTFFNYSRLFTLPTFHSEIVSAKYTSVTCNEPGHIHSQIFWIRVRCVRMCKSWETCDLCDVVRIVGSLPLCVNYVLGEARLQVSLALPDQHVRIFPTNCKIERSSSSLQVQPPTKLSQDPTSITSTL